VFQAFTYLSLTRSLNRTERTPPNGLTYVRVVQVVVRVDTLRNRLRTGPEAPVRRPVQREFPRRRFVGVRLSLVLVLLERLGGVEERTERRAQVLSDVRASGRFHLFAVVVVTEAVPVDESLVVLELGVEVVRVIAVRERVQSTELRTSSRWFSGIFFGGCWRVFDEPESLTGTTPEIRVSRIER